jgi:cytochrome c553
MMRHCLLFCTVILQAAIVFAGAVPSPEAVNSGVFREALKNLPAEFDGFEEIIFVQRGSYEDPHWYANIGYFCDDENNPAYTTGGQLCKLNLKTGKVTILLETADGCIRDPKVHYDAEKIIFAWRKENSNHYNLYEMNIDGSNIKQITSGPFDDYEPEYLPDDRIVFVSTRARRWVGCWYTQVGTIHRCEADGKNITMLSCNIDHDNTPAVLPNGQILYMRWEYIDRSQVEYHHLWTMNPDGSNQTVYYGNQASWGVFLDCRPIPDDDRVMGIYSPGHGMNDHYGWLSFFSNKLGPDDPAGLEHIEFSWGKSNFADPWPLSAETVLTADRYKSRILLVEKKQQRYSVRVIYEMAGNSMNWIVQAPRPILKRPREKVLVDRTDYSRPTGTHVLVNVYDSRNMEGVKRGEIKKLLIIETLPKPVNFSGGQDLTSWLGSFNLERILGTVPVEPDGSAYFEVPANTPVFYVALDEKNLSCKRMQSFTSLMPGETITCLGCHENRQNSPRSNPANAPKVMALNRRPSRIHPVEGAPDVPDFTRDVQPVLDKYCISCHNTTDRKGRLSLEGDMGCHWSISYYSLIMRNQVADGRNGLGNQPARSLGSSASELLRKLEGTHHDVKADYADWVKVWAWTEAASPFCGTYGGLRNTNQQDVKVWVFHNQAGQVLQKRCYSCHKPDGSGPQNRIPQGFDWESRRVHFSYPTGQHERLVLGEDPLRYYDWNVLLNATRPKKSAVLMAPLAKAAGGWGICPDVFKSKDEADYKTMAQTVKNWQGEWLKSRSFGSPSFQVNSQYIREMVRFGVLPENTSPEAVDPYATDRKYWQTFAHEPSRERTLPEISLKK